MDVPLRSDIMFMAERCPDTPAAEHGVFHSVVDLRAAINRFIEEQNHEPRPFIWKADPDDIIAAVKRGHQVLESIH